MWIDWGFGRQKNDRVYGGQLRSVQRLPGQTQFCTVALLIDLLIMVGRTKGFKSTDPVFFDRARPEGMQGLSNKVYNSTLRRLLVGCVDGGASCSTRWRYWTTAITGTAAELARNFSISGSRRIGSWRWGAGGRVLTWRIGS